MATTSAHELLQAKICSEADKFVMDAPREDPEEIFAEEKERQAKQDAAVAASWSKRVLVEGTGRKAWQGAKATLHIVGRLRP